MKSRKESAAPQVRVDVDVKVTNMERKAPPQPATKAIGTVVYCGPSVKGVAKQYTVFHGGIPRALAEFADRHKAANAMIVPIEKFAEMRNRLETAGTAEARLYQKIKSEL